MEWGKGNNWPIKTLHRFRYVPHSVFYTGWKNYQTQGRGKYGGNATTANGQLHNISTRQNQLSWGPSYRSRDTYSTDEGAELGGNRSSPMKGDYSPTWGRDKETSAPFFNRGGDGAGKGEPGDWKEQVPQSQRKAQRVETAVEKRPPRFSKPTRGT